MFDIILCDSIRNYVIQFEKLTAENSYPIIFKVCVADIPIYIPGVV